MTQGEKVDELMKLTVVLEERLKNVQSQLKEIVGTVSEMGGWRRASETRLGIIESQVGELRQTSRESASKRSAFVTALITAFIVAVLGFLAQLALAHLTGKN